MKKLIAVLMMVALPVFAGPRWVVTVPEGTDVNTLITSGLTNGQSGATLGIFTTTGLATVAAVSTTGTVTTTSTAGFVGNGLSITNVAATNLAFAPQFSVYAVQTQTVAASTWQRVNYTNAIRDTAGSFISLSNLYKCTMTGYWDMAFNMSFLGSTLTNGEPVYPALWSKVANAPSSATDISNVVVWLQPPVIFNNNANPVYYSATTMQIWVTNNPTYFWISVSNGADGCTIDPFQSGPTNLTWRGMWRSR